jgi:hypothetical protein
MNVEICASKVVADNPSASAPQQGNTQMVHSYPGLNASEGPIYAKGLPGTAPAR